jgi:hypothetical protein
MAKKRDLNDLPPDLIKPIRVDQILAEMTKRRRAGLDHHGILAAEVRRRVALMAQYLGIQWPENEDGWLRLVVGICSRWRVPGFQLAATGSGRKTEWPVWKNWELIIDVWSRRLKNKKLTDHAACQYIADHAKEYDNRYPDNPKTLYRQFQRAKNETDEFDSDQALATLFDPELERKFLESMRRIDEKLGAQQFKYELFDPELERKFRRIDEKLGVQQFKYEKMRKKMPD